MVNKLFILVLAFFIQCKSNQSSGKATLENTYWRLIEVKGKTITTPENGREIYMEMTRENDRQNLKGHAGCNSLGGSYTVEGNNIKFEAITTRMFCEAQMEAETLFIELLTEADTYAVEGQTLLLYRGNDLLGKFQASKPAPSAVK